MQDLPVAFSRDARGHSAETRPRDEIEEWRSRDPIARLEALLTADGVSTDEIGAIRARVQRDLEEAIAFADASPFPDPKDLLVDMFAE